ncbi:MAG: hypothetical protein CSB44_13060 [Gammaproteobacteria bacterium]|nr:MAG: hypothetical protein CSB44_13060 [Gammaproteobacteria bacterium]
MITSSGVGSGIDIESIVSQLMTLERQPIENLSQRDAALDVQLSAFGSLKGALSSLESAADKLADSDTFGAYEASSSDEEVITATTTRGTSAEQHEVEVLSLATTHRMSSTAFDDIDAEVGEGVYAFSSGETAFDVIIDAENNSLAGLRDAINEADGNTAISASIINVDGGSRLVLTARESGTDNIIAAPAMFTELEAASDAELRVDGFPVTSNSNDVSGVIPGVTLTLEATGEATLQTARNTESFASGLEEFVTAYNAMRSTLQNLAANSLSGESILRGIESSLRQDFFAEIPLDEDESVSVFELGLSFDRYGVLSLDQARLGDASAERIEDLVKAFVDPEEGFGARIAATIESYTESGGAIDSREDGIDARKRRIGDQIERLEYRMEQTETRYRRQFGAMDSLVAELQNTSGYLASQLGALNINNG